MHERRRKSEGGPLVRAGRDGYVKKQRKNTLNTHRRHAHHAPEPTRRPPRTHAQTPGAARGETQNAAQRDTGNNNRLCRQARASHGRLPRPATARPPRPAAAARPPRPAAAGRRRSDTSAIRSRATGARAAPAARQAAGIRVYPNCCGDGRTDTGARGRDTRASARRAASFAPTSIAWLTVVSAQGAVRGKRCGPPSRPRAAARRGRNARSCHAVRGRARSGQARTRGRQLPAFGPETHPATGRRGGDQLQGGPC